MRLVGQICLLGALVGSGYSAAASIMGWRGRQRFIRQTGLAAGIGSVMALTVVVVALAYALLTKDFRFDYVARYSSRLLPWYYSVSSLWVGQAGSLLLWTWFTALLALVFRGGSFRSGLFRNGGREAFDSESLREPAFGVVMGFCCFLTATMVFAADPMAPSLAPPADGAGLSPLLQHPSMLIHPPIVFLGYAAWTIPFALAVTALASGQLTATWAREARPWALFAWIVLGSGILIGAQWAYAELGWGGYWSWDPVENGSLIPWLVGTSAIHSLMAWRYRGMLKKTALVLTITTFGMCNFATFLTRSGIFSSLHAFSQSPIGWLFLALMIAIGLYAVILITLRRHDLTSERSIASLWCRESMVVISTTALVSLAVVVCIGTLSAAISEILIGRKVILGLEFYNNTLIPTGLIALLAAAAAPLLRWGSAPSRAQIKLLGVAAVAGGITGIATFVIGVRHPVWLAVYSLAGFAWVVLASSLLLDAHAFRAGLATGILRALRVRRRQYAGFVVHIGLFCLAIGVTASSLGSQRRDVILHEGESMRWAGRRVKLQRIVQRELPGKHIVEAVLDVQRGSGRPFTIRPAQHFHVRHDQWTTETSVHSSWTGDLYAILHNGEGEDGVRLTLVDNPMMRWIWLGGGIMAVGAVTAIWPARSASLSLPSQNNRQRQRQVTTQPMRAAAVLAAAICSMSLAEKAHGDVTETVDSCHAVKASEGWTNQ